MKKARETQKNKEKDIRKGAEIPQCLGRFTIGDKIITYRFRFRELFGNARLFIILFVRNFWRVCSQFWLSVRNSV